MCSICQKSTGVCFGPKGRNPKPAGPRPVVGYLGKGPRAPPHQLEGLGSAVSSPSRVRNEARPPRAFGAFYLPPTKEEVHVFAGVCLSVCLLARLLKNACMDLDEMLRVDICRDVDELTNFLARSGS